MSPDIRERTRTEDDSDTWEGILKVFELTTINIHQLESCQGVLHLPGGGHLPHLHLVLPQDRPGVRACHHLPPRQVRRELKTPKKSSPIRVKRAGVVGPGLFFILPCLDTVSVVDLRTVSFDVPSQEILTSDSVTVSIDAVVYYNIEDPMAAICNVELYAESTKLLAATTLRNMMGTKTLMQILEQKEEMARVMKDTLDRATDPWGIRVEMIEVKCPTSYYRP